jgi:hypothetical protein
VQLPSDRLIGLTAGLRVELPRLAWIGGHPLGVHASGVALALGSRSENLSEGRDLGSYGGIFGGGLAVALWQDAKRGQLQLGADYAYAFAVTRLGGPSQRNPGGTGAILGDAQHLITAALAYAY